MLWKSVNNLFSDRIIRQVLLAWLWCVLDCVCYLYLAFRTHNCWQIIAHISKHVWNQTAFLLETQISLCIFDSVMQKHAEQFCTCILRNLFICHHRVILQAVMLISLYYGLLFLFICLYHAVNCLYHIPFIWSNYCTVWHIY